MFNILEGERGDYAEFKCPNCGFEDVVNMDQVPDPGELCWCLSCGEQLVAERSDEA